MSPTQRLLFCIVLALPLLFSSAVGADTIGVQSAELRSEDDDYVLNAQFDVAFNPTLEEALQNGVSLYFVLEFDLGRPRWYWVDEKLAQLAIQYRITYSPLTRQYRVSSGLLGQQLNSLDEVEHLLSRVVSRPVVRKDALTKGVQIRRRRALATRRRATAEAISDQRAGVAGLVATVGVVSLELHAVSGILAPRVIRYVLLASACLGAIFLFLLATASANTELFASNYNLLLILNGTMVAVLMGLVGYQLLRLRRNLKAGVFGSRLAVRLVLLFSLVAVVPGALLYGVSVQFLGKSIESWFDVRVDRALEGGLNLARGALDYLTKETVNKATQLALTVQEGDVAGMATRLSRASEQSGVYEADLFTSSGGVLAVAGISVSTQTPAPPPQQALRSARLQKPYHNVEQMADQSLMLRVVVPVNSSEPQEPLRLLQVMEPVPRDLQQDTDKVQSGYRDYQEISFSRSALKRLYALTLTLTLLLALFSALGLAVVLSEQFSGPLGLLAEGTRAVAQGDFSRRHPVQSRDELGVLTESFNTMTAQLAEAQHKTEDSRRAIETTRAYLREHSGESVRGCAGVRQCISSAHRQPQCRGHPAAAARRTCGRAAGGLGSKAPRARAFCRYRRGRVSSRSRRSVAASGRARGLHAYACVAHARFWLAWRTRPRLRGGVR